ncbi:hypothetical protein F4810DRAFT_656035 [Camillea tinctor]|nr:hypothetical protein F4810DRAFT_656035 [Camillea tinctor]
MDVFPASELIFWVPVVAVSIWYNVFWAIISISLALTHLHYLKWPFTKSSKFAQLRFIGLVIWCVYLSPAQVFLPVLMDLWAPSSPHLSSSNPIDIVYDSGKNAAVDIFAIHGLGSNPDSAWTYWDNGTEMRWLKEILPKEEGLDNIRIVMANHLTHWTGGSVGAKFEDHAEILLRDIERAYKSDQKRPVIFIAHSFGGLLLKQTLLLAKMQSSPIATMTRGILFLGVPHSGTKATYIGKFLSYTSYWRGSSTTLLEYMAPGSDNVIRLEESFYNIYASLLSSHSPLPYICDFLELKSEKIGKLPLGQTVDRNSARSTHGEIEWLNTDHRGLNKFKSPQDPNFRKFLSKFRRAFEVAPTEFRRLRMPTLLGANFEEYYIPFQLNFVRNDKFTGRNYLLERIHESLTRDHEPSQLKIAILQGTGGIGKTELAVQYAHLQHQYYSSIFWVDCSTENSVQRSFSNIATRVLKHYMGQHDDHTDFNASVSRLGLKGLVDENGLVLSHGNSIMGVVEAMKNWFTQGPNNEWLLIFDNLDNLEAFDVTKYIPTAGSGNILITSRRKISKRSWTPIKVEEMSEGESLSLLAKTAGFDGKPTLAEQNLASELVQRLGHFPLAIEQAGAYISHRVSDDDDSYSQALDGYLDLYKRNAKKLFDKQQPITQNHRNDTILTTWEVSFNAVRNENPEAAHLLLLCGFLANSDIFEEMINLGWKLSPNDLTFDDLARELSSYSLVSLRGANDAFLVHPLVQFWARERLSLDVQRRLAKEVVQLVARGLRLKEEQNNSEYMDFERRIIPHLKNAIDNVQMLLSSTPATNIHIPPPSAFTGQGTIYNLYEIIEGWYLWIWGAINDVSMVCRRHIFSDVESISEEWQLVYKLGSVYRDWSSSYNTESIYRWAFSEARARLHIQHPKVLEIAGDLAHSILWQGRYDEAEDWYSWLLTSREKVLGKNHPATLGATKGLATISELRGDADRALKLYLEAWAGREEKLGQNDILTINVVSDICGLYYKQRNFAEALPWYKRMLSAQLKMQREEYGDTLRTMYDVGVILEEQGNFEEALRWYGQNVAGQEEEPLGKKHESTLLSMHAIGGIYEIHGQDEKALHWYKQSLAGFQEKFGEKDLATIWTVFRIGEVLKHQRNFEEALFWYKQALVGFQETAGENDPSTVKVITYIAEVLEDQGEYKEALGWLQQALAGSRGTFGEKHKNTIQIIDDINRLSLRIRWGVMKSRFHYGTSYDYLTVTATRPSGELFSMWGHV